MVTFSVGSTSLCTTLSLVDGAGSCSATTAPTGAGTSSRTTYYYDVAATNRVGTGPVSNRASAKAT
jgi:hypothetical protein